MSTSEGKCRICGKLLKGEDKTKSHILTESTYFSALPPRSGYHFKCYRDGIMTFKDMSHYATEQILCRSCEQQIGVWEDERERLFSSNLRSDFEIEEELYLETYEFNSDYIKLACLADIYRCSVSSYEIFSGVNLGCKHSEIIRKMLLNGAAGDKCTYPVVLFRFNNKNKEKIDPARCIPNREKSEDGINIYRTMAPRGWVWVVKVDQRSCPMLENDSISSSESSLKIINYGDPLRSQEYLGIISSVAGK